MGPRRSTDFHHTTDELRPGDVDAFERLFTRSLGPLSRYAYGYVKSWDVAEDLVHDVFVQLWRKRDTIDAIENLESWLYSLCR